MQHRGPRYKTGAFIFWSRLWVDLTSSVRPVLGAFLQFGHDDDLDARFDVAVDLDRDLVRAERLDGLVHPYPAPVEADAARLLHRVGDVGGGNGAEEALVLAGAGLDGDHALVERGGDLLGALGEAPIALLALDLLGQYHLHRSTSRPRRAARPSRGRA